MVLPNLSAISKQLGLDIFIKDIDRYTFTLNIKILTQMITGHTVLRRHLHIMKIEEDPTCEHCMDGDETVEHFICD